MKKSIRLPVLLYCIVFLMMVLVAKSISKTVSVISDNDVFSTRTCVIIDPGHGGVDGGATSCTGITESTLNLQIALRLNDFMHFIGIDTLMIRTADVSVYTDGNSIAQKKISDLKERVRIVNERKNAILISIHQNQFSDSKFYGPQVFYGAEPSKHFAEIMQSALKENLCPESKRQAKKSNGIYLMQKIVCDGLLIECGFLSNPEEEAKLRNTTYQKEISAVIATTCANYISDNRIS